MKVSVSQEDINLLTRLYRFCEGYDIPEGEDAPTLADVVGALEEIYIISRRVDWHGDEPYTAADAMDDLHAISGKVYPVFSAFKPVQEGE